MEAIIRRAGKQDVPALASVCYMAGRSHCRRSIYDLLYPGPWGDTPERLTQLERTLATAHVSWLHHTRFMVAEVEGRVAAGLSGFSRQEAGNADFGQAFAEMGWTGEDFGAMAKRMTPCFKVDPPKPDEVWVVENVAAFPDFRRRGLVDRLLREILSEGRARGFELAQINILTGNAAAQRAYEKVGFRVDMELADPSFEEFFGSPGMTRMLLEL